MKQSEALALLESGRSVLLTGAAGTGKTYVLNEFVRRARRRGKNVAITATTGLAATHLSGTTIHAWAGIGIYDELPDNHVQKMSKQRLDLIRKADILVIDEISMLHDFRLDIVEQVTRAVREVAAPFGGLQVVMSGDFFQLPPVNRRDGRQGGFVISSIAWESELFTVCYLDEQYRQSNDETYAEILNGIRSGMLTRRQLQVLQDRQQAVLDPWATHTRLLTTNTDVDSINKQHLADIEEDTREYVMFTSGGQQYVDQLKRSCLAPEILELKIGAHVMCIKNSKERRYVNGSLGVVRDFDSQTGNPIVELTDGRTIIIEPDTWELMDGDKRRAQLTQLPLRLAWAITVHKSQGMTLDAARVDLGKAFVEGMGYVALSRVRGLQHLVLEGLNGMALRVSPLAREIDADLRERSEQALHQYTHEITAWQKAEDNRAGADIPVAEADPEALERLKIWRRVRAADEQVPPYIVAHDTLLATLATSMPQSEKDLQRVKGMGPKKIEKYGADILSTLRS